MAIFNCYVSSPEGNLISSAISGYCHNHSSAEPPSRRRPARKRPHADLKHMGMGQKLLKSPYCHYFWGYHYLVYYCFTHIIPYFGGNNNPYKRVNMFTCVFSVKVFVWTDSLNSTLLKALLVGARPWNNWKQGKAEMTEPWIKSDKKKMPKSMVMVGKPLIISSLTFHLDKWVRPCQKCFLLILYLPELAKFEHGYKNWTKAHGSFRGFPVNKPPLYY